MALHLDGATRRVPSSPADIGSTGGRWRSPSPAPAERKPRDRFHRMSLDRKANQLSQAQKKWVHFPPQTKAGLSAKNDQLVLHFKGRVCGILQKWEPSAHSLNREERRSTHDCTASEPPPPQIEENMLSGRCIADMSDLQSMSKRGRTGVGQSKEVEW